MGCYRRDVSPYGMYVNTYEKCWNGLNPFISNRVFEVLVSMKQVSALNFAKLCTMIRYGVTQKNAHSLTGVRAEDPLYQSRVSLL